MAKTIDQRPPLADPMYECIDCGKHLRSPDDDYGWPFVCAYCLWGMRILTLHDIRREIARLTVQS